MSDELGLLLQQEKQARQASDFKKASDIARSIVQYCFEHGDYKNLSNSLTMLSKRRGQEKQVRIIELKFSCFLTVSIHFQVVQAAVQETMVHLTNIKDTQVRKDLIITLRAITEGKVSEKSTFQVI